MSTTSKTPRLAVLKLAVSALVLGTTMVGCSMSGQASRPANVSDAKAVRIASVAATRATKAMTRKQHDRAIVFAETAVAAQPRMADYRMLLGQAYLAAGRFTSAETSFADTLTLDPNRERAALNLALVQIALGKQGAARSTLGEYRERLSAADFGLATALAGDPVEAVRVLEFAARAPDANAKVRQNLALAYALAGQWANAKVMAVQDLAPAEADARVAQWASFAKPVGSYDQVASLLGVTPVQDAGQPVQLALNPAADTAVQVALAEPAPEPAPEPVTSAAVSEPETLPAVAVDDAPRPAFETAPAAVTVAEVPASTAVPTLRAAAWPVKQAVARAPRATRVATPGRFVVQLGAYASNASAERAWTKVAGRFRLAGYDPVNGTARVRNASLVRLSVSGFAQRIDADRLCGRIKATGGSCFVRMTAGDATARWVQRTATRVASR